MKKSNNMQSMTIPGASNFRFSAIRPEELGATEYTLATIVVDISSSVSAYDDDLRTAIREIVHSLKRNPRAENLLVRLVTFNSDVAEVHGFKPLADIKTSDYRALRPSGMTALFDASFDAIAATEQYAGILDAQDYDVNGAIYIVTDGGDNRSGMSADNISDRVSAIRANESMESILIYLIGINTREGGMSRYLQSFRDEADIDHYIDITDADASSLARLAGFVSQSISNQSQALGSGAASQPLRF